MDDVLITNVEKRVGMEDPEVIGGLRVFDNTDPRNPKFVKNVETDGRGIVYDFDRKLAAVRTDATGGPF